MADIKEGEDYVGRVDTSRADDPQALAAWVGRNLHGDTRMNKAAKSGSSVYSKKAGGKGYATSKAQDKAARHPISKESKRLLAKGGPSKKVDFGEKESGDSAMLK